MLRRNYLFTAAQTALPALCCFLALGVLRPLQGSDAASAPDGAPRSPSVYSVSGTSLDAASVVIEPLRENSEPVKRLLLLEFADQNDSDAGTLASTINGMRDKNYPIQRVETGEKSARLFQEYGATELPTYVLLRDGKEFGRVVVKNRTPEQTLDELLALFDRARDSLAKKSASKKSKNALFGLIFKQKEQGAAAIRAQAPSPNHASAQSHNPAQTQPVQTPTQTPQPAQTAQHSARVTQLSDAVGRARIEDALAVIRVTVNGEPQDRVGTGVAIHYNAEFHEALFALPAKMFENVDVEANAPLVTVEKYYPTSARFEELDGQCVYCDAQTGLAFVAARLSMPTSPVAFLPRQSATEAGDSATEYARFGEEVKSLKHDVIAVGQRRFYQGKDASGSVSVLYDRLIGKELAQGGACFVSRNGRLYFAGITAPSGEHASECEVVPSAVVSQALLSNRNLAAVYRDQTAGKFDVTATPEEIAYATELVDNPTAPKKPYVKLEREEELVAANDSPTSGTTTEEPAPKTDATLNSDISTLNELDKYADLSLEPKGEKEEPETTEAPVASNEDPFAEAEAAIAAATKAEPKTPETAPESEPAPTLAANATPTKAPQKTAKPIPAPIPVPDQTRTVASAPVPEQPTLAAQTTAPTVPNANEFAANVAELAGADQSLAANVPTSTQLEYAYANVQGSFPQPTDAQRPAQLDAEPTVQQAAQQVAQQTVQPTVPTFAYPTTGSDSSAPLVVAAQTPDGRTVQYLLSPLTPNASNGLNAPLTGVQSVSYAPVNDANIAAYEKEEADFNAALETLKKYAANGAEIVCIVNWASDPNGPRESEVVRLPKRTVAAPGQRSEIELAQTPAANLPTTLTQQVLATQQAPRTQEELQARLQTQARLQAQLQEQALAQYKAQLAAQTQSQPGASTPNQYPVPTVQTSNPTATNYGQYPPLTASAPSNTARK